MPLTGLLCSQLLTIHIERQDKHMHVAQEVIGYSVAERFGFIVYPKTPIPMDNTCRECNSHPLILFRHQF